MGACGYCHRGEVCCEDALALIRAMELAFRYGLMTGDWLDFNRVRDQVEQHYCGTGSEEERHLHTVDVEGSTPSSRTMRGSPSGDGRGLTRR